MKAIHFIAGAILLAGVMTRAGTLGTFQTSVGTMELEFFDEDKPITVSNFVKYVTSGEFTNMFIQRWEVNFVIQAGGFRVTNTPSGPDIEAIPAFGTIKNEFGVGPRISNTYGTIAMARQPGNVNSASSQWFLNLTNSAFLDTVDEGFTVFGRVTSGTNVLNLFIPPPPREGIYRVNAGGALSTLPVRNAVTNISQLFTNLIYIDVKLRRELGLTIQNARRRGERQINWTTVAGVMNSLEYTDASSGSWNTVTNVLGTGAIMAVIDSSTDKARTYRVKLIY